MTIPAARRRRPSWVLGRICVVGLDTKLEFVDAAPSPPFPATAANVGVELILSFNGMYRGALLYGHLASRSTEHHDRTPSTGRLASRGKDSIIGTKFNGGVRKGRNIFDGSGRPRCTIRGPRPPTTNSSLERR